MLSKIIKNTDYVLFFSLIPILFAGLMTMKSLGEGSDYFFNRQLIWIGVSFAAFFLMSLADWRFLRKGNLLLFFYFLGVIFLFSLLLLGKTKRGTASWFDFRAFSLAPAEPMKILVILILAKYFARRHIAIAQIRHILISAFFAFLPAVLVFLQPDFGSAFIFIFIWFGMVMVSGISRKHLTMVAAAGLIAVLIGWNFLLAPYQQARISSFLYPQDLKGAGYNADQSVVAVGSGRFLGKGIGGGTQSRLKFLPEHETDFIFAAFAEEWGFIGVLFLFIFFTIALWRILKIAFLGQTNFERLFSMGLATLIFAHFFINVGMNIGLLPVTGITLPFMSYGGSAMAALFGALGILESMRRYSLEMPGNNHKNILDEREFQI
ncbi:MAG: rod shape-determining protein RodA [Candidatus Niyogibacteria bacterium]|nr:rod shape-determining protein RodA [Candidatus Niyogibacteria bacterium]